MSENKDSMVPGQGHVSESTRIALLEQQIRQLERRVCGTEQSIGTLTTKLDEKVAADTWRQLESEKTLARILATMEAITLDLKEATEAASKAQVLATKHETIAMTVMKVGSILTVVCGAVWTVAQMIITHL